MQPEREGQRGGRRWLQNPVVIVDGVDFVVALRVSARDQASVGLNRGRGYSVTFVWFFGWAFLRHEQLSSMQK